jgi:beta-aspartyl-peptidase (threonine type)
MYAIAVHGGAGVMPKENMTPEMLKDYTSGLLEAIQAGYDILESRGSSIDAVEKAVVTLENNILFNAGRGSVFTFEGKHEMEASVMNGKTLASGAVSGIKNVRNPVMLARLVMDESHHVFLAGEGAEKFAAEKGLAFENEEYFYSSERYRQLQEAKLRQPAVNKGTVGAVALDESGNLAAATSTGGLTAKKYGRIGDSPIIGAGTYANNLACAVSCTGDGEYFIRSVAAHDIFALVEYAGCTLREACEKVIMEKLPSINGDGGAIAIDKYGNIEMIFNSNGMFRGYRRNKEQPSVHIYKAQ